MDSKDNIYQRSTVDSNNQWDNRRYRYDYDQRQYSSSDSSMHHNIFNNQRTVHSVYADTDESKRFNPNLALIIGIIVGLVVFVSLAIIYPMAFCLVIGLIGLIIFLAYGHKFRI